VSLPDIVIEVTFEVALNSREMPTTYSEPEYLEEVITEAIQDAMYDLGAEKVNYVRVEVDGL
jgi:uncharacterized protein (UPF0212 family)